MGRGGARRHEAIDLLHARSRAYDLGQRRLNLLIFWHRPVASGRGSQEIGSMTQLAEKSYRIVHGIATKFARKTGSGQRAAGSRLFLSRLCHVSGGAVRQFRRFHHGFAQRRVRMDALNYVAGHGPISIASTPSAIISPAPAPQMPTPSTRFDSRVDQHLGNVPSVAQCSRPGRSPPTGTSAPRAPRPGPRRPSASSRPRQFRDR